MSEDRKVAQAAPYEVQLEAGRNYFWCRCGRSQKQPFCDGTHKGTGIEPLRFTANEDGRKWLCGCKQTGNEPFCDGAHNKL